MDDNTVEHYVARYEELSNIVPLPFGWYVIHDTTAIGDMFWNIISERWEPIKYSGIPFFMHYAVIRKIL